MKFLSLAAVLALAITDCQGQAEDHFMKSLRRGFNYSVVDLSPLAKWWADAAGTKILADAEPEPTKKPTPPPKPLSRWVRVQGNYVSSRDWGWVVDARITDTPMNSETNARIFLKHPPAKQKARFEELTLANVEWAEVREGANWAASEARLRSRNLGRRANTLDTVRFASPGLNNQLQPDALEYRRREIQAHWNAQASDRDASFAEGQRDRVNAALAAIPQDKGDYMIDFFALRMNVLDHGLPVYDLGVLY